MRQRGIREKNFYLANPFPAGWTQKRFASAAGFKSLRGFSSQDFFRFVWTYNTGLSSELIVIEPGILETSFSLRESEAGEFQFANKDNPLAPALILNPQDREEVLTKSVDAVERAAESFSRDGTEALLKFQTLNSYTDQQMSALRSDHPIWYVNQQVEALLLEHAEALRAQLEKAEPLTAA